MKMPSIDEHETKPSVSSWTLRLKNHKSTVLLSVLPQTDFHVIKQQLLTILSSTHPSGKLNGHTIPSEVEDVILATPKDLQDLHKGWTELVIPEQDVDELLLPVMNGNSKNKKKVGGKKSVLNCPQGVGLKDGAALAFRFVEGTGEKVTRVDDVDEMDVEEEDLVWDVVLPTYDDEYGSQA